jgi:hypothetical protein
MQLEFGVRWRMQLSILLLTIIFHLSTASQSISSVHHHATTNQQQHIQTDGQQHQDNKRDIDEEGNRRDEGEEEGEGGFKNSWQDKLTDIPKINLRVQHNDEVLNTIIDVFQHLSWKAAGNQGEGR